MIGRCGCVILWLGLLVIPARSADTLLSTGESQLYRAVRASSDEQKWLQIPWMTDLEKARAQARRELRPLFVWTAGDDPLNRC